MKSHKAFSDTFIPALMEIILGIVIIVSPWVYGGGMPEARFLMEVGVASLMLLWIARMIVQKRLIWRSSPVVYALGLLALIAIFQLLPLPRSVIGLISPATATVYQRTLPTEPEATGVPLQDSSFSRSSGSTISLDPYETRLFLFRVLTILLLFTLTISNLTGPGTLRRLALAAMINGILISLFAIVQFFTSVRGQIYWSPDETRGGFGTFLNRNHYALYVNVCIGLTFGVLISRLERRAPFPAKTRSASSKHDMIARQLTIIRRHLVAWLDAENLGLIFALVLMTISIMLSLSRGGMLSLAVSFLVGLLILQARSVNLSTLLGILFAFLIGGGLLSWIGYEQVVDRLQSLDPDEIVANEGRLPLWIRSLKLSMDFPLSGTGFGTFENVEGMKRTTDTSYPVLYEYAHNEYLQFLVEGGLLACLIGFFLVFIVFRAGLRAARSRQEGWDNAIALGGLVGFLCAAFHSFTDFGMQAPANAALVTVVAAHLCNTRSKTGSAKSYPDSVENHWLSRAELAKAVTLSCGLVIAGVLVLQQDWQRIRSESLRSEAILEAEAWTEERARDLTRFDRKVEFLQEAVRLAPTNSLLRYELAESYFLLATLSPPEPPSSDDEPQEPESSEPSPDQSSGKANLKVVFSDNPEQVLRLVGPLAPLDVEMTSQQRLQFDKGLEQLLVARNLSPIRPAYHLDLADHSNQFKKSDSLESYLNRATWLAPANSWAWFRRGEIELRYGKTEEAMASYQRSLEFSGQFLPHVIDRCMQTFPGREWADTLIPDNPERLIEAARIIDPRGGGEARALLERALQLFQSRKTPDSSVRELQLTAGLESQLGFLEEATETCELAMKKAGADADFRLRILYADLLRKTHHYDDARLQLLIILAQYPEAPEARGILDAVEQAVAEGR